jgi:hypothetical protein
MDIPLILQTNYSGLNWSLIGEEYKGLTWLEDSPKPTKAELEDQWPEVQNKAACFAVESQRKAAYSEESDPLFFKYQRSEDGVTKAAWLAKVDEIRERFPMPES